MRKLILVALAALSAVFVTYIAYVLGMAALAQMIKNSQALLPQQLATHQPAPRPVTSYGTRN